MFSMFKILEKSCEQSYLEESDDDSEEKDLEKELDYSQNMKLKRRGERTVNTPQTGRNFNMKIEELQ